MKSFRAQVGVCWRRDRCGAGSDDGFTLVELLVAILILTVGVLGVTTMAIQASSATADTKAREGATNLAREVVETMVALPYSSADPGTISATLQAKAALAPAAGYSGWTVVRRQIAYTVSVTGCYIDDPSDGTGTHDSSFCSGSSSGSSDDEPIDYKRFTVRVSWQRKDGTRSVTQTTLIAPRGQAPVPSITSLTSGSGIYITDASLTSVSFTATTSATPAGVAWTQDQTVRGLASGSGTTWQFTWNISGLADGQYDVGAEAYNSSGTYGDPRSLTITLNRTPPSAPSAFAAGWNRTNAKVDSEWLASTDLDTVGYSVYRQQTSPTVGAVTAVNCGTVASPVYINPDTTCTDASPIIPPTGGTGTIGFRAASSNQASSANTLAISAPSGVLTGDLLVATVVVNQNTGLTAPSGWTLIRDTLNGTVIEQASFYHVAVAGEPASYSFGTANAANRNLIGGITAFSGVDTSAPIDVSGAATGASGNAQSPNLTTTYTNDRLINPVSARSVAAGTTATPASTFTERWDRVLSALLGESADASQATAGATGAKTATFSSGNGGWISQLIALKPNANGSNGISVNYWVKAVDRDSSGSYREGPASNVVNAYAPDLPPSAITSDVTCTNNPDGSSTVDWTQPPTPNDPDSGDYIAFDRIYRDGSRFDTTGLDTDQTWTDANPGGTHAYYVTTVDTHLMESAAPSATVTC
jgi:type IV pilus modification protein PilV